MSSAEREIYRIAVTEMNERLIEIRSKISYGMKLKDNPTLPNDLRAVATKFRRDLERHKLLTPARDEHLARVHAETAHAETAAKNGNEHEVWAALSRACGSLNNLFLDVNEAFFRSSAA